MKLDNFIGMMTGHFDNKEQFNIVDQHIIICHFQKNT